MGKSPEFGTSVRADIAREEVARLFGNASLAVIMRLLASAPDREFSVSDLIRSGPLASRAGAQRAIDALIEAEWVDERREGRERLLRINPEVLASAPDPYAQVPRPFRDATRHFVTSLLRQSGVDIWKVLLFGGLAVGRGDRLSDIDLLVVTPSARPARVAGSRLADELRLQGFRGQRFKVHLLVETPGTLKARRADPSLPALLRNAVRLWDDPRHPLEPMLPEVEG